MSISETKKIPRVRSRVRKVRKPKKTKEQLAEISRRNGRLSKAISTSSVYPKADKLDLKENIDYDFMQDMYDHRANIAPEVKLAAVTAYMTTGTLRGAERLSGVGHQMIGEWKNKAAWWPTAYAAVKKDRQEELDARLTNLIASAFDNIEDRIVNGDEIITTQGERIRRKMSGKDLATTGAIMYDKRAMLRGDPTTITGKATATDMLASLRAEFTAIAKGEAIKELDKTVVN